MSRLAGRRLVTSAYDSREYSAFVLSNVHVPSGRPVGMIAPMSTADGLSSPTKEDHGQEPRETHPEWLPSCIGSAARHSETGSDRWRIPGGGALGSSRGRGVFLENADDGRGAGRSRWIEAPVAILALAIAAFALAVCVNAPSI